MNMSELNNDSCAIMLLCSNLALNYKVDKVKPITGTNELKNILVYLLIT